MQKTRKDEYIRIALEETVEYTEKTNGFERYELEYLAFPDIDFDKLDTKVMFAGKELKIPFMITALTGGTEKGEKINKNLAKACERLGIAMGLGSQRIVFDHPETLRSFYVRHEAPHVFLFGNLGIHHLKEFGPEKCKKVVSDIEADGLAIYLNPIHEVSQEKGNPEYSGLKNILEEFCNEVPFPVIIKETGNGLSEKTAIKLKDIKISAIDIAGAGGTSCVIMEYYLAKCSSRKKILKPFLNQGIPAAESLLAVRKVFPHIPLIASGGIRSGLDCAKAIALGADLVGMALPLLKPALISSEHVEEKLIEIIEQFKIAMFTAGVKNIEELRKIPLQKRG